MFDNKVGAAIDDCHPAASVTFVKARLQSKGKLHARGAGADDGDLGGAFEALVRGLVFFKLLQQVRDRARSQGVLFYAWQIPSARRRSDVSRENIVRHRAAVFAACDFWPP